MVTNGLGNTAVGYGATDQLTTGSYNTSIGTASENGLQTGNYNTALGYLAGVTTGSMTNSTAIGSYATVTANNSLVLGSINGINSASADTKVGIGTTAPTERLDIGTGTIRIRAGAADGYVFTSDANGVGAWAAPSGNYGYTAKTATYTASPTDNVINCTSGTFTVTLPTAVGISGHAFIIKLTGTGVTTVNFTSGQTADGFSSKVLSTQYAALTFVSDGANYIITSSIE